MKESSPGTQRMDEYTLDDVDRQLLELLEENARYTAIELAEHVGVSDNTIHNRMDHLREPGVIQGYTTSVDHDRIGLDLSFVFSCTARISRREDIARRIRQIPEVVEVIELMTGEQNILVKAVAADDEDISRVAAEVDEFDVEINDENLVRAEHTKPLNYSELGERMVDWP